jgi:hypothetical protein
LKSHVLERVADQVPDRGGAAVTVTRYFGLAASVTLGLRIHWFVVPFAPQTTVTAVPSAPVELTGLRMNIVGLTPLTASLNVAVTLAPRRTPVTRLAGGWAVTVGLAPVVNVQLVAVMGVR